MRLIPIPGCCCCCCTTHVVEVSEVEFFAYLLSVPGIQVNLRESSLGGTSLHVACYNGHQAIVSELLQDPAVDINVKTHDGYAALNVACTFDKPEIISELLGHPGIDVNQTGGPTSKTSLHSACSRCNAGVVRELLKHPAILVNQKTVWSSGREGRIALQCCLFSKVVVSEEARLATLKELLKHPGLDRGDMKTALHQAEAAGRLSRCAQAIADVL